SDLTAIVQEIVNRSDWNSGNALAIIVKNAGPASGTYRHRRVIGYDRPVWYPGTENAARLVIRLGYDCTDYKDTLSNIGQAVFDVVGEQNYCLNKFEKLTFIEDPSSGRVAFQEFAELASQAKYEVDFTTMIWDDGDQSPGQIFLQGVKELHTKVQAEPNNYPSGIQVRILLGFDLGQSATVLSALNELGIPPDDPKWKVEVTVYPGCPNTHSHVKMLVVDGQKAIVSGYNMQNTYLDPGTTTDVGIKLSGPIVQDALEVFDSLWVRASGLISHAPSVLEIRPGSGDNLVNAFSLFRDNTDKTADASISGAIRNATQRVNFLQNRFFENYPPEEKCFVIKGIKHCIKYYWPPSVPGEKGPMPYSEAIVDAIHDNCAEIRLLLSGIEEPYTALSLDNLRKQILARSDCPTALSNLQVKFTNNNLHAKSLSLDGQFLIVGSQNFDFSAFGEGGFIDLAEYSFGVDSVRATGDFDQKFEVMWENARAFTVTGASLQATVMQAAPGTIIFVPAGVYRETVTIDKPLTLIGDSGEQTIIEPGATSQSAFWITSSGVTIVQMSIRGGSGYGIELIDVSPSSLKDILVRNVVFDNNALGGVFVQSLIPGSPIQYTLENNTFIGGQSGVTHNLIATQPESSFIRNNIFVGQAVAPIRILSSGDGQVEYSYNLFSICRSSDDCAAGWRAGNLSAASNAHNNLFDLNPQFLNPTDGDFSLSLTSLLIDAGNPDILHEMVLDGNGDGVPQIDIGAFESFLTSADLLPMLTDDAPDVSGLVPETSPNNVNLRYFICPNQDEDWFRFRLERSGNLQVHLTSLPANYDLYVYNAAGQLLGSSTKDNKAAELVILRNVPPGNYYVRIVGVNGNWSAANPYQLRFNVPGTGSP
ncbi:MAG: phospholipase D-like domain-containing protein, partial [Anaerolineales bacterium]|nr:phospholipase D-like domain-containing protein [Anaerolineales bacterium]